MCGSTQILMFSPHFGEPFSVKHFSIFVLTFCINVYRPACWYRIQKKGHWISDLDWKMWNECFLQIIQTRCGLCLEKMFFKVNSVCVFGLIIFSRRNRAKWSFGNIFSHFHVLVFQKKLDRAEVVQFQWEVPCRGSKILFIL